MTNLPVFLLAAAFSPAVIQDGRAARDRANAAVVVSTSICARADFPAYPLRDYAVRCQILDKAGEALDAQTIAVPLLKPGDQHPLNAAFRLASSVRPASVRLEVVRPTGVVTTAKDFRLSP